MNSSSVASNFVRFLASSFVCSAFFLSAHIAIASPTDIVAQESILRDNLVRLSADGLIRVGTGELLSEKVLTRADCAQLLETGLSLSGATIPSVNNAIDVASLRSALVELRPELMSDHVDVDALLKGLPTHSTSMVLALKAEARFSTGNNLNSPGSGFDGIYRGTVVGDLDSHTQYGVTVSNEAEDDSRVFTNDVGPHDFSALSQAYVKFNGARGLNFLVGRTDNNWGGAAEGGSLLSDSAPPLDQLRVSFPFSLGSRLGRNWSYMQLASTYTENGGRRYFQARRVEINFSNHWSAQYEEGLKSTSSSLLDRAPLPFLIGKSIDLSSIEAESEFIGNFGLNYSANKDFRAYGQLLINDIKSPFKGHVLGFDLGNGGNTPQRLAYVGGLGYENHHGTNATVEYSTADATTYEDSNPKLSWTKGAYNYLGFPAGPNFKQIYGIVSQQVAPKITVSLEGRSRKRFSDSYPAPDSQDLAASAMYTLNNRNSFSLTYHDYYQDAYAIAPGAPGYPTGNGFTPVSEANPGSSMKIHELDAGYEIVF